MKRTVVLLITVSMLLALFGCAPNKPASTVNSTTTEPTGTITEASGKKATIDRALFDDIVIGKTTRAEYLDIVRGYEYEYCIRGRNVDRFKCSDGGYIYVEFTCSYEEDGKFKAMVVRSISDEYTIPVHDRALFEQITVGMSERDLYALLDGEGGTCVTSGHFVFEYLLTDGSRGYLSFGSAGEGYSDDYQVVAAVSIKEPTNE